MVELLFGEEVAKCADGASRGRHGVEWAEIHHVNSLLSRQVCTRKASIQPAANRRDEDVGPSALGAVRNVAVWTILEVRAKVMIERVVHAISLGDHDDVVRVPRVGMRPSTSVCELRSMEALGEVLRRLDHARLA